MSLKITYGLVMIVLISSCKIADLYEGKSTSGNKVDPEQYAQEIMTKVKVAYNHDTWRDQRGSNMKVDHYWHSLVGLFTPMKSGNSTFLFDVNNPGSVINMSDLDSNLIMYYKAQDDTSNYSKKLSGRQQQRAVQTLAYFIDLPMKIQEAQLFYFQDSIHSTEADYLQVLATWQSLEANKEYDQFLLWVDAKDYLIRRVDFTSRGTGKSRKMRMQVEEHGLEEGIKYFKKMSFLPIKGNNLWRQIIVKDRLFYK